MTGEDLVRIILLVSIFVVLIVMVVFSNRLAALTLELTTTTKKAAEQNERLEQTIDRMEQATKVVAVNLSQTVHELELAARQRVTQGETLDRMEEATHVVADNLASSVSRADATEGPDGAAADAALRTGDTPEEIHERQDAATALREAQ